MKQFYFKKFHEKDLMKKLLCNSSNEKSLDEESPSENRLGRKSSNAKNPNGRLFKWKRDERSSFSKKLFFNQ